MGSSTKQKNQYNPASMSAFNTLTPQMQGVLSQYMQNPWQAGYFQQMLQQGSSMIGQQGAQNTSNILQNARTQGWAGAAPSAYTQGLLAQSGRGTSAAQSNLYGNLLLGAQQLQSGAAQTAAGYRPLQTGTTTTQSGLGTWLPQAITAGAGLALAPVTGGGSLLGSLGSLFGRSGGNAQGINTQIYGPSQGYGTGPLTEDSGIFQPTSAGNLGPYTGVGSSPGYGSGWGLGWGSNIAYPMGLPLLSPPQ